MELDSVDVDLFTQRCIEVQLLRQIFEEFSKHIGKEKTLKILQQVIDRTAKGQGKCMAAEFGGDTTRHLAAALKTFTIGGANELDLLELTEDKFSFNVTRCKYAEMYKELGLEDLGLVLSCNRDFAFAEGFNHDMELIRTKTILEGSDHCDFRYKLKKKE
jgi:hypothetical protein